MNRFALAAPRRSALVRERPDRDPPGWEASTPWEADYDERASLGPLLDLPGAHPRALRESLAVQTTLYAVATATLDGDARAAGLRRAARALARSPVSRPIRAACVRALWACRRGAREPDRAAAAALCGRLAELARACGGPHAAAACQRLRFALARRHGLAADARGAARELARRATLQGEPEAARRWETWAGS